MPTAHTGALVVLLMAVAMLTFRLLRERADRKQRNLFSAWPIPTRPLTDLDPVFRVDEFGPTRDAEVTFLGRGSLAVPGGTSDTEAWVLAALARRARLLFEFGTCTGKTAYLWARNAPADARVVTVTLRPEDRGAYRGAGEDAAHDTDAALAESDFARFVYSGTDVEQKVEQLYGDSKALDVSPWAGQCDLVFVDGSHAYSYVISDSRKALELVKPRGIVLWHDYGGPRHSPGVYRGLSELAKELPLMHLEGTRLVAYRRPAADAPSTAQIPPASKPGQA
ncbi:MAG: hypothetical protein JWN53_1927 [Gemmatimonadetes bacterium]|nr:hypothetical protein [Gemmatimonadota bacterium]